MTIPVTTAEPAEQARTCTTCRCRKPYSEFRRLRAGEETRHPTCNECRRVDYVMRKEGADRRTIVAAMTELRRRHSAEAILGVLEGLANNLGGMDRMSARIAELLDTEGTPNRWKLKVFGALLGAGVAADEQRMLDAQEALAERKRAGSGLREMLREDRAGTIREIRELIREGALSLDDLDPPPNDCE